MPRGKGPDPEGEVIEILESQRRLITGKLQVTKGFAFLITEDKTLANDIFIPKDKLKGGLLGLDRLVSYRHRRHIVGPILVDSVML